MLLSWAINIFFNFSKHWKEAVGVVPTFQDYQGVAGMAHVLWQQGWHKNVLWAVCWHTAQPVPHTIQILGHWRRINCHRIKCVKITQCAGKASVLVRTQWLHLLKAYCLWTIAASWTIPNLMCLVFLGIYSMIFSLMGSLKEPIKQYPVTLPIPLRCIQRCNIHSIS